MKIHVLVITSFMAAGGPRCSRLPEPSSKQLFLRNGLFHDVQLVDDGRLLVEFDDGQLGDVELIDDVGLADIEHVLRQVCGGHVV